MAALSQAGLPAAFRRAAAQCGLAESDFLLLGSVGIFSFEAFALRVSSKEDLEEFLKETVCPGAAFRGDDGVLVTFARTPGMTWGAFKMTTPQVCESCGSSPGRSARRRWPAWRRERKALRSRST